MTEKWKTSTGRQLFCFGGLTLLFLAALSILYAQSHSGAVLSLLMLTPAVSVVLTRAITREGFGELYLRPHFKGNVKWYFAAYFSVPLIAYLGAFLYFLLFPGRLDPLHSSFAMQAGVETAGDYQALLLSTVPLAIIINPIMGILQCFGEEFAWRGYLLPHLCKKTSTPKAVLLTGVIWGVWHAPIIAMGFNYGTEHPFPGVLAMILLCLVLGVVESWLFLKTNTVWPSVLFHAAINGIDLWPPSLLLAQPGTSNPFIGPNLTGIIGGIGFLLAAVICFADLCRKPKGKIG